MRPSTAVAALAMVAACSFDGVDPRPADDDAAVATPDASPMADAVPIDAAPSQALVDRGLVARYFLDEAALGQGPQLALDVAPEPVHLNVTYAGALTYATLDGNRCLQFGAVEADDRAAAPIAGTKIENLDGRLSATWEVVADARVLSTQGSRLVHIGFDDESHFSLELRQLSGPDALQLESLSPGVAARWRVDPPAIGRVVYHMVFDSAQPVAADRVRLYIDGVPQAAVVMNVAQDEPIDIATSTEIVLGNRTEGRTFEGELFYAALYDDALDAAEIDNNVAVLLDSDDRPPSVQPL